MKYDVGDRIRFDQSGLQATGVIVGVRNGNYVVLLDESYKGRGHDGDMDIADGRGWFVCDSAVISVQTQTTYVEISAESLEGVLYE